MKALLGDYPATAALKRGAVRSDTVRLEFADVLAQVFPLAREEMRVHVDGVHAAFPGSTCPHMEQTRELL